MASDNPFEEYRIKPAVPSGINTSNPFAEWAPKQDGASNAAPGPTWGETAADVAKSGGIGLVRGAIGTVGGFGDIGHILGDARDRYIANPINRALGLPEVDLDKPDPALKIGSGAITSAIENHTGQFYAPRTTVGRYTETAGELAPALFGGGEGLMSRLVTRVAAPAIASETAGELTEGTAAEPWARMAGALMSPAILAMGRRAITPLPASAERSALVDVLRQEGIQPTAGQATGSRPLMWMESALGDMPGAGGGANRAMEEQRGAFTQAALRRVGENADRASPEVIDRAFSRIGNDFQSVGQRNHMVPDTQLVQDLRDARNEYQSMVGPHARAPVVDDTIADIAAQAQRNGGVLPGDAYNAMTSRLARLARQTEDPQLQAALYGTRDALDGAMERSLQASGNTADLARLQNARREYRNLMVIEKAATGVGSNTGEGVLLSPARVRNAVVQQDRRGYARGNGDFSELARAADAIMKPLPQSGTAPRQYVQHLMSAVPAVVSAGIGGATAGLPGMVAGAAAPGLTSRILMSRPVQSYLGNQALLPGQGGPRSLGASPLARAYLSYESAKAHEDRPPLQ